MQFSNNDATTITAVSTPPGTGGIAVVRLSGPHAFEIADSVWSGKSLSSADSHTAHLGEIIDSDNSMLDQAVATVYGEGRSFTGEPTVEFAIHGSRWLQRRVVERLVEAGASPAPPGEFTRRAFLNGRIDLAQAEGVADMIAASSKASQRIAARQMKGGFSKRLGSLREKLVEIASLIELELDFSEEDVEFADRTEILTLIRKAKNEIDRLADSFKAGRALKEGLAVVIAGSPNAGKSTLLNQLLQEEKAIVSDIAGTTRDLIEDKTEINGILFRFIDTAGLRETNDHIERLGVDRARRSIAEADILLWILDPTDARNLPERLREFSDTTHDIDPDIPRIILINKTDIASGETIQNIHSLLNIQCSPIRTHTCHGYESATEPATTDHIHYTENSTGYNTEIIAISAKSGEGIQTLTARLTEIAQEGYDPGQDLIVTNARHYEALRRTSEALSRTECSLRESLPPDLTAQDLREATHHLGTITGAITPDNLLQTIFSRFCVGK